MASRWLKLRHLFLASMLLLSVKALAAPHHTGEQSLDNIVAIVNDDVITRAELNQSVHLAQKQFAGDNTSPPPLNILRKQILRHLINEKLQLALAEQNDIQVNEADLNKVVSHIAQDNGISVSEFYRRIEQEGLNMQAYRKQIRQTLTLQRLQQREVASRINVSQEEITNFLKSSRQQNAGEKEYHIQDILIGVSDSPSPQELAIAKKFAENIASTLRRGSRLNELPSAETESLQDNDLGWRKLAEIPTAFTTPLAHMKRHDYSTPIQTANGFHIIHLTDLRSLPSHQKSPRREEVAQLLFQRKFEEAMQGWLAKIRGQAFISIQDKSIA